MRTFEFRVYKLRTKEALEFYIGEIYPRHLKSFPLFGIEAPRLLDRLISAVDVKGWIDYFLDRQSIET